MEKIINAIVDLIKKGLKKNPLVTILILLVAIVAGYFVLTKTPLGEQLGVITPSIQESVSSSETDAPTAGSTAQATTKPTEKPTETVAPTQNVTQTETAAPTQTAAPTETTAPTQATEAGITVTEDGQYKDKDHVALYIHTYGHLPSNYYTKKEAEAQGGISKIYKADSTKMASIGGDTFGNREGLLPKKSGRTWTECDIDYTGGSRNATRIVFSNDGLIYFTDDHYESFTQLY